MQNDNAKFKILRKHYPKFIYEKYSYEISGKNLEIFFNFQIPPDIKFQPKIIIENATRTFLATKIARSVLDNLIFHLGLMEIPSYWKATCSREIEIRAGYLNKKQTDWWKDLMIKGMGQFYYENKIDWRKKEFLSIRVNSTMVALTRHQKKLKERYLVPFAGGRDSIVTLEGLKKRRTNIALFAVNPIEKIRQAIKVTGVKEQIIVRRIIDKKLLDLNKKGYLNGHTPFTSVLSFISVLCAVLFNYKNIAFSNEKSADEGNVKYLGKIMNHQWAKSAEFEKMFKDYVKKYLAKDINYFSFIRKYGELEISKMLIKYPKYFPVFSSCNAGMKINNKGGMAAKERWCGNCPKCLFVYMSLYPLLKEKELLKIFGRDIFQNKKLLPTLYGLLGQACPPKPGGRRRRSIKPLECVGTKAESQQALKLCLKKALGRSPATGEAQKSGKIPYLLTKI